LEEEGVVRGLKAVNGAETAGSSVLALNYASWGESTNVEWMHDIRELCELKGGWKVNFVAVLSVLQYKLRQPPLELDIFVLTLFWPIPAIVFEHPVDRGAWWAVQSTGS